MVSVTSTFLRADRRELPADFFMQERPVVSVSAPAGYGKSTLMAVWRRELVEKAWKVVGLTVDPDDRDGDRLIVDLLHAMAPADAKRTQMLLGGVGDHGKRAVIMALLADLSSSAERTVVFIDDIHWLADGAAHTILRLLISHQPAALGLVLGGRSNVTALASEALLEGRMHRFGPLQLAFNAEEVGELLAQYGHRVRPSLVRGILDHTQGWPAAVRLIAMTMHGDEQHQDSFLRGLFESREALTEYLSEVLLSRLPERSARFLLGISLLRRFSVSLAAAATGMEDARRLLEDLERRALPLSPSADATLPYSLHPLVREFLLERLRREDPRELAAIAARARTWLDDEQKIDAAIDLSLDVGDVEDAAALIDHFARTAARHYGRHATFLYWCNKIPTEHLSKFPRIQAIRVWSLSAIRRYDEAEQNLAEVVLQVAQQNALEPSGREELRKVEELVELEACVQVVLRDRWFQLGPKVRAWLARWPNGDRLHQGMAHTMIGCSEAAASHFVEAMDHFRMGQKLMGECKAHYVLAWGNMWGAVALIKQGNYRQALHGLDEAVSDVALHLGGQTPAELMLHALRALVLYETDRFEDAGNALEHGLTALAEQSSVDSMIAGCVTLARLQNARGSHLDALETLAEGEVLGWSHNLPRLAIALAAERTDLLLRQGAVSQATHVWKELKDTVSRRPSGDWDPVVRDKQPRIEARLALARHAWDVADDLLASALQNALATGQKRKQVELLVLQALAAQGLSRPERVQDLMRGALDIAMPQGYIRVFADEGEAVHGILFRVQEGLRGNESRGALSEYLRILIGAAGEPAQDAAPANPSASSLTRREIKILKQLQSSLSNREMADALFITEGTLKWHLKNIYSKLGVASRVAAISVGREAGLLN